MPTYQIRVIHPKEGTLVTVPGRRVTLPQYPELEFFVHKDVKYDFQRKGPRVVVPNKYMLTEMSTGMGLATGATVRAAVVAALARMARQGKEGVLAARRRMLEIWGYANAPGYREDLDPHSYKATMEWRLVEGE